MKLYGIKNCNNVKKARDFLDKRSISYEFFDFKIYKPEISNIKRWVNAKGIEIVLNSKGKTYKDLNIKNLGLDLSAKILKCYENPMLLKRPIVEFVDKDTNRIIVGFNEKEFLEFFGEK